MAITSMGVRSALRTTQDQLDRSYYNVVETLAPTPGSGANGKAPKKTAGAPNAVAPGDGLISLLEKVAVWIPGEVLAAWLIYASAVNLYDNTRIELYAAIVATIVAGIFAFFTSLGAHVRRGLSADKGKAITTALLAGYSFFVYWMATPGSLVTADWRWPPAIPVGIAAASALLLPFIAQALKVEPKTSSPSSAQVLP